MKMYGQSQVPTLSSEVDALMAYLYKDAIGGAAELYNFFTDEE